MAEAAKWVDRTSDVIRQVCEQSPGNECLLMSANDYMFVRRWVYSGSPDRMKLLDSVAAATEPRKGFVATLTVDGRPMRIYISRSAVGAPVRGFATEQELNEEMVG